jgi:hypothetical protein
MTLKSVATFSTLTLWAGMAIAQVNVTTTIPANVSAGGEFTVEINVDKGAIAGFAKLQHDLPTGFEAVAGESANATFSFKDRKVKYLWMALPNDAKFKVSYKVKVDPSVTGSQIIEGNFSYIKDNNTEKFLIPKDIISVQGSGTAQPSQADQLAAESKRKEEEEAAARKAAEQQQTEPAKTEPAATDPAKTESTGTAESANTQSQSAGGGDDAAKQADAAAKAEEKRKADEAVAAKKAEEKRAADDTAAAKKADKEAKAAASKSNFNDAMLKSADGLVFRVQVMAGPREDDPAAVKSKFNIAEEVKVEKHDGLNKYVVGEFGSYRAAKTFCNTLRDTNSVPGPWVVAYHNGERIDVKRALEIAGK